MSRIVYQDTSVILPVARIHTVQLSKVVGLPKNPAYGTLITKKPGDEAKGPVDLRINLEFCKNIHEAQVVLQMFIDSNNLTSYILSRVDFAIDYFDGSYEERFPANSLPVRLLIYHVEANTESESSKKSARKGIALDTDKTLSISLVDKEYEIEYYDKKSQSDGFSSIVCRLEMRRKKLEGTNSIEALRYACEDWIKVMRLLPNHFSTLCSEYNKILLSKWRQETKEGYMRTFTQLICRNKDLVFSRKQLLDLCKLINPNRRTDEPVKYFLKNNDIVLFKHQEVVALAEGFARCMQMFMA